MELAQFDEQQGADKGTLDYPTARNMASHAPASISDGAEISLARPPKSESEAGPVGEGTRDPGDTGSDALAPTMSPVRSQRADSADPATPVSQGVQISSPRSRGARTPVATPSSPVRPSNGNAERAAQYAVAATQNGTTADNTSKGAFERGQQQVTSPPPPSDEDNIWDAVLPRSPPPPDPSALPGMFCNEQYTAEQKHALYIFRYLLVFVAALESFAHGANDTGNATGTFDLQ